jgi:type I restriction enzyme, S subunit
MSEWKEFKLNEIYDFGSGLSKPRSEFGHGYGFLSYKDIFRNYFVPDTLTELVNSTEKEQKSCSIQRGDVFLTRTSETDEELGMSCVALKDYSRATFNGFTKRLRPNKAIEVLPEYAGFFFRSPNFRATVSGISSITTRASLNNDMLSSLSILVPPIDKQIKIAETLKSLHDKIDLLHRQNATLEKMAETLFRQWFVEEAKKDWKEKKLGEFFPVITGKKDANYSSENGQYPFFTCSQKISYAPDYSFDGNAILLAGNGDFNVKRYKGKFEAYQRTYILIPFEDKYFDFLYVLVKYNLDQITEGHQGSVINFITKGMITEYKFYTPKEFDEKLIEFKRIYEKVDLNTSQIRTLTSLRDTLLPKLMSGEVRVEI